MANMVRVSFDVPVPDHIILKMECAQARIAIKDFMMQMVLKGIQELQEKKLQDRLKTSIQQAKNGKVKRRGSFAKYVKDEV